MKKSQLLSATTYFCLSRTYYCIINTLILILIDTEVDFEHNESMHKSIKMITSNISLKQPERYSCWSMQIIVQEEMCLSRQLHNQVMQW